MLLSLLLAQTLTVSAPDVEGHWPARAIVEGEGPFAAFVEGSPLPTQSEPHLRGPGGKVLSSWVGVTMPPGLEGDVEINLKPQEPVVPPVPLPPLVWWALSQGGDWGLYVEGIEGGLYATEPNGPFEAVRVGPVETIWRGHFDLVPVIGDGEASLPHMGAVTIDARVWAGVEAIDLRVLWRTGEVTDPNAYALFDSVGLRLSVGGSLRPLVPTAGMGDSMLGSTALAPAGGVLPHSLKLWSAGLTRKGNWHPALDGAGWASPEGAPTALGATLSSQGTVPVAEALEQFVAARAAGFPLDGNGKGASTWRHASGSGYGGATGGGGIGVWHHYDWAMSDPVSTYRYLWGWTESRLDRSRWSLLENGRTWLPEEFGNFNFAMSPELLYQDTAFSTAWPSGSQDPFGFRGARPEYRQLTAERYAVEMKYDRSYGTEDGQHFSRTMQGIWPLVELYREPMAILLAESAASALVADYFHKGSGDYTATLAELAKPSLGSFLGREFAWAGWHNSLLFAYGSDQVRDWLMPWMLVWGECVKNSSLENGIFHVFKGTKELDASHAAAGRADFYPAQTYQNMFVAIAEVQVAMTTSIDLLPYAARLVDGMTELGWGSDSNPDYKMAVLMYDGTELSTREEVEEVYSSSVHPYIDGNVFQSFHTPLMLAAGRLADAVMPKTTTGNTSMANLLPWLVLDEE